MLLLASDFFFHFCCSFSTELQFAGNFGGIQALIAVFNWYPSCICIILIIDILLVVYDCPSTTCMWCGDLHLSHDEWHAIPGLGGPGGPSSTWGKGARKVESFVQCGGVGLMLLSQAIWLLLVVFSRCLSLSGPWCSYCIWKYDLRHVVLHHIWDSGSQHGQRSYSGKGRYPVLIQNSSRLNCSFVFVLLHAVPISII